jgi:uncharacterized PurR-regulated membrane protein YhhQ (DUF165 family)
MMLAIDAPTLRCRSTLKAKLLLAIAAYVASIVLANVLTNYFGLVSIGFGLLVTAGTFAAGAALVLRDAVQVYGGRWYVLAAILGGACLSIVMSNPTIALASGIAFLVSEIVDWGVFTPVRKRSMALAVVLSSVVSAPVDTVLFLWLAGFGVSWSAVIGQFIVKTLLALVAAGIITLIARKREQH